MEINVQQEFNIHNIEMFNYRYFDHTRKSGLVAMLTITGLYNIFWFSYGILIPILNRLSSLVSYWLKKINLPVMPIWIGIFLMINSIVYSILEKLLPPSDSPQFLDTLCEIRECNYSFVFMLVGFYFYNRIGRRLPSNSQQLGA
jgi:hypothetical protein